MTGMNADGKKGESELRTSNIQFNVQFPNSKTQHTITDAPGEKCGALTRRRYKEDVTAFQALKIHRNFYLGLRCVSPGYHISGFQPGGSHFELPTFNSMSNFPNSKIQHPKFNCRQEAGAPRLVISAALLHSKAENCKLKAEISAARSLKPE